MRYLRDNRAIQDGCAVYSNGYDAIYLLTGIEAKSVPVKSSGPVPVANIGSLRGTWPPGGKACLVQLDEIDRRAYLFTATELLGITDLESSVAFDDGTIYVVSRK
jgi:hypothetical protein